MDIVTIERMLSSHMITVDQLRVDYPRAFPAGRVLNVCESIIAVEEEEDITPSLASADTLRQAGYFDLLGKIMHMVNREKTVPRVDWDIVEEIFRDNLEPLVERWAPYLERYRWDQDPLLEDYFDCIEEDEVRSDESHEGEHWMTHQENWRTIYANRRAAVAEYVESNGWYRRHYPVAHAAFRAHIEHLVGGNDWRFAEVVDFDELNFERD